MTQIGMVGTNAAIPRLTTLSGRECSRCVRPMRLAQENGFGATVRKVKVPIAPTSPTVFIYFSKGKQQNRPCLTVEGVGMDAIKTLQAL